MAQTQKLTREKNAKCPIMGRSTEIQKKLTTHYSYTAMGLLFNIIRYPVTKTLETRARRLP